MNHFNYDNIDHEEMLSYFDEHKNVSVLIPLKHLSACKSFMRINKYYKSEMNKKYGILKLPVMFIAGLLNGLRVAFFHTNLMFISPFFQLANFANYKIQVVDDTNFILKFNDV